MIDSDWANLDEKIQQNLAERPSQDEHQQQEAHANPNSQIDHGIKIFGLKSLT